MALASLPSPLEYWDMYDRDGNALGRTITRGERFQEGEYHLVVQVWLRRVDNSYLIQQRVDNGLWATTAGCVIAGETRQQGALREIAEELGIRAAAYAFHVRYQDASACALGTAWELNWEHTNQHIHIQFSEVQAYMWANPTQIRQMVAEGRFYNYGDSYFRHVFSTESDSIKEAGALC